jgi:hypothetical protein
MTKVLTFKVGIEGLEDKIWRKIEITDRRTVADLAYTILATFRSLAYHLYDIEYKNKFYDCWICIEDDHRDVELVNAVITKLSEVGLKENDTMRMKYDTGSTTTFIITYLGESEFKKGNGMHYPCVIDGAGYGMIADITGEELKKIVEDIDKKGKSDYYSLCMDGRNSRIYDYRVFDIGKNNLLIKRYFSKIKHGYEDGEMA